MAKENYSSYLEQDPTEVITVSQNEITFSLLDGTQINYVIRDFSVNHFSGNFLHIFDFTMSDGTNGSSTIPWALTNELTDINTISVQGGSALTVDAYHASGVTCYIILYEIHNGAGYSHDAIEVAQGVKYYYKIVRDESIGTYGTQYIYIYTDEERTNLAATLTGALHEKGDYRYLHALSSVAGGSLSYLSGAVGNLDINEPTLSRYPFVSSRPSY